MTFLRSQKQKIEQKFRAEDELTSRGKKKLPLNWVLSGCHDMTFLLNRIVNTKNGCGDIALWKKKLMDDPVKGEKDRDNLLKLAKSMVLTGLSGMSWRGCRRLYAHAFDL